MPATTADRVARCAKFRPGDVRDPRHRAERGLHDALGASAAIAALIAAEDYAGAMAGMAKLRGPLDEFFEKVTVNAADPHIRRNRLRLLNQVRTTMDRVADFSRIEG